MSSLGLVTTLQTNFLEGAFETYHVVDLYLIGTTLKFAPPVSEILVYLMVFLKKFSLKSAF